MATMLECYSSANINPPTNSKKAKINSVQMRLFQCFHHLIVLSAKIQNYLFCTKWSILNVNDCKAHRRKRDQRTLSKIKIDEMNIIDIKITEISIAETLSMIYINNLCFGNYFFDRFLNIYRVKRESLFNYDFCIMYYAT
jgi:hypothetical protein